jgi:hypothetical protein
MKNKITTKKVLALLGVLPIIVLGASLNAQTFSYDANATANAGTGVNFYTATSGNNAGGSGGEFTLNLTANFGIDTFVMQSGSLTFNSASGADNFVGFNGKPAATLDIQGGTLTFNSLTSADQDFMIANGAHVSPTGNGTITQEGGTFNVEVGADNGDGYTGFDINRDNGVGNYVLSGGTVEVNQNFLLFGSVGTFNFTAGSTGALSLLDGVDAHDGQTTLQHFTSYLAADEITVGGAAATLSEFTETTVGGQDIFTPTPTPEPSTYALLATGTLAIVVLRRQKSARV